MFVENCNGLEIYKKEKLVFGKKTTVYVVKHLDSQVFTSGSIQKCRDFCQDYPKIFQ